MTTPYNLQTQPTDLSDVMSEISEPSRAGTPVPYAEPAIPLSDSSIRAPTMATASTVPMEMYNHLLECLATLKERLQVSSSELPPPAAPARPARGSVNIVSSDDSEVTSSRSDKLGIKIKKPETWKGDNKSLSIFPVSVSMYCGLQPRRFHSDYIKIRYAGSLFRDIAMQWWTVEFAKADKPIWMYDWSLFSQKLTDTFDPGDCEADAGKRIANLKQNKSAANYYTRFMEAATETLWNESAQI